MACILNVSLSKSNFWVAGQQTLDGNHGNGIIIRASNGSFGLLNIPLLRLGLVLVLGLGLPVGPFPGDVMTVH